MKTLISIILSMLFSFVSMAGDYEDLMKKNIEKLGHANDVLKYQEVANTFDRIANSMKDQWLPAYYASLSYVWMANVEQEKEKQDACLDAAQKYLDGIKEQKVSDDELTALQGYIYMIRISVDPAKRGQQLSAKAMKELNTAVHMDPSNPRALFLLARMEKGMAEFFGSGSGAACEKFQKALDLFKSDMPQGLMPAWGQPLVEQEIQGCK